MRFTWNFGLDGFYFLWEAFGWHLVIDGASEVFEPMIGIGHPDGRFLGFWTEDFEFDRYPVPSEEEKKMY
jgi:hypothetical protein